MSHPSLSVVIVNFRTPELVKICVASIVDLEICSPERIVIVDNFSNDGSAEALQVTLPRCRHLPIQNNRGYSAGLNSGIKITDTDLVLCLNPDTYFLENSIERLMDMFFADPKLALVGLDLHYPSGERQFSARRNYSLLDILIRRTPLGKLPALHSFTDRHLMTNAWKAELFDVDWVIGTGFVVRRAAFDDVGGMDEGYFLYMEDVDLCQSLRNKQWRVRATSAVRLIHDHQRASAQSILGWSSRMHLKSLWRYRRKHGIPLFPKAAV